MLALISNPETYRTVPWGACLLFAPVGVFFGACTLDRRARLTIDAKGITDVRGWVGFIAWSDIAKIEVRDLGRAAVVNVSVRNPDQWYAKLPVLYRLSWSLFPKWRIIGIPLGNVDVSISEVRSAIHTFGGSNAT